MDPAPDNQKGFYEDLDFLNLHQDILKKNNLDISGLKGNIDKIKINRYDITWGDGDTTSATSDSTPTHTYSTNTGSPFDVTVRAYNSSGSGACSEISKTRTEYIIIYTADPVVSFAAYAASSGGSPITQWDDGDTIYFENTTTNTSGATVQYTWDWGDGSSDDVVSSDASAGGVGGGRLAHTFTASTEQEQTRTVTLTLDSHSTALPSAIPTSDNADHKIYDTHTPSVTLSATTGINVAMLGITKAIICFIKLNTPVCLPLLSLDTNTKVMISENINPIASI